MESMIARFLKDFVALTAVHFLCAYTVRDGLRIPMRKLAAYILLFVTAHCLGVVVVYQLVYISFFSFLGTAVIIIFGLWLMNHAVSYEKGKLAFTFLLVLSYHFFTDGAGNIVCVLLNFSLFDLTLIESAIYILCIVVTIGPFAKFMRWLWSKIRNLKEASWNRLCLVPGAFILTYGMHWEFYSDRLIIGAAFPVLEMTAIISALIIYWQLADGLSKAADAARFSERLRNVNNQLLLQAELIEEVSAHEGKVRQIRHDMRHHFAALETMLAKNDNGRARAYLHEYIERVEDSVMPSICRNVVVDAVSRRYIARAGQMNIRTDVAVNMPKKIWVADSDLAVLFSNLWENALEACQRQMGGERRIQLRTKAADSSLMISMTNSFSGETSVGRGEGGEPVLLSLKRGGKEEGIGITSIRAIVKRYCGVEEFSHDAGNFNVRILLYTKDGEGKA